MKKILLAPDSFKGSLSAPALCVAMTQGIRRVFPHAEVLSLPLADGGEGTMEILVQATGGHLVHVDVTDPLGRPVQAAYGVLPNHTAVIELAQASGLTLLLPDERNPLRTTTYGTGELLKHALDAGHRQFLIGLGGSATNDAGAGLLQALGLKLLDTEKKDLPRGGSALAQLHDIDASDLDPRLQESRFLLASDVQNPLTGPAGASAVFGPQKGASPEQVPQLDLALTRFGDVVHQHLQRLGGPMNTAISVDTDFLTLPGGGAAGGTAAGLLAFLPCTLRPGIEVILETLRFEDHLRDADLVLTGEGRLDDQTLSGKTIAGVCRLARLHEVPVIALCGSTALTGVELDELGLQAAFSLVPGPCSLDDALLHAAAWTADRTEQLLRLLRH
ncbi:glycerate kinase [Tumebacillus sp. ITR2]|uniref:Glycerate kinase n=1 Tax=Tumebacillus amylolyticus TaxID=2801339 RepID=A0ABS1J619_9BACL|nr:glycerate kinase [Tumebacillus amylolyticus]MBL0385720.1 glycerate kinase [Tumebacillus amylolyticus]